VNADLTPAILAAGGGATMLGGIAVHERRRDTRMRASRVRLSLRYPRDLDPTTMVAALDGLSGLPHTSELVIEVAAREGAITHG
jgi:hypothetical protein